VIAVTGDIAGFRRQLALEMARLDREISASYVLWTKHLPRPGEGTAQWSGNLTANWNYGVGGPTLVHQIPNKRATTPS
jgi:hypothetical protein